MTHQQLHKCRACPVFVPTDEILCKTCGSTPEIGLRNLPPAFDRRKVERRETVIWNFSPDVRVNADRRASAESDLLSRANSWHDCMRRYR